MYMARLAYALIFLALITGCNKKVETPSDIPGSGPKMTGVPESGFKDLSSVDIEPGKGEVAKNGDVVVVLYVGKFTDGVVFDSNMDDNFKPNIEKEPYAVSIGTGGVIKGWDIGLVGAKEGMVRKINVPWKLAYGTEGQPPKIPPKSDMIFTLKILKVYKVGKEPEIEIEDTKVGTGPKVTLSSTIRFKYKGMLMTGKVFDDQSKDLETPVSKLIPGFKEAVVGMQAGGRRKISWPPGAPNPTGQIPPGQPIEYIVDITSVK
jgi:FKBP-type peptidyl-prolyl cis-trans isomerase